MEGELRDLKIKKGNLKGRYTKFKNYFEKIDKTNITDPIIKNLEKRLENFEPVFHEYSELQSHIELLEQPNEVEISEVEQFEDNYYELIGNVKSVIDTYNNENRSSFGRSEVGSVANNSNQPTYDTVKLPPIQLPKFDGQYSSWFEFRDAFLGLVDKNSNLTDYQKFYYLRQALVPEALKTIKSLKVTSTNYAIAWNKMVERYENENLIINSYIKDIFESPQITTESAAALRHLHEQTCNSLSALKALGEEVDTWDRLIIYILVSKFDMTTKREWESYKCAETKATLKDIETFIKNKCELLEKISFEEVNNRMPNRKVSTYFLTSAENVAQHKKCILCKNIHTIYTCEQFLKLSLSERWTKMRDLKVCTNCLKPNHVSWKCKAKKCSKCHKSHNVLLHYNKTIGGIDSSTAETTGIFSHSDGSATSAISPHSGEVTNETNVSLVEHVVGNITQSQALLSTAIVKIKNINNEYVNCRALLDSGSQSNFITEKMCLKLGIRAQPVNFLVKGVGQSLENISKRINIKLKSSLYDYETNIDCLVLPTITEKLPLISFDKSILNIPEIDLADQNFNQSGEVDLLIGSGLFWSLLCVGKIELGRNMPILRKTKLGWVIGGNLSPSFSENKYICHVNVDILSEQITKFWNVEEINHAKQLPLSAAELYCESYFNQTTRRDESGRFIVKIPFRENLENLGDSLQVAIKRFNSLEKKLDKDSVMKKDYHNFINEYLKLGHMSEVNLENEKSSDTNKLPCFYLPHHGVVKTSSLTTRLRVVFDGSAKTDTGVSLNDIQFIGPKLQNDLFDIIIRFRKYYYVLTGDISKMYRQILITEEQRRLQRIIWRSSPSETHKIYELKTVTYGLASSPYLALKCLHTLSEQNSENYPVASEKIKNDFYIDDLLTGADSIIELVNIQKDASKILRSAGFDLRKWLSNSNDILSNIEIDEDLDVNILQLGENELNKTLGILWNARSDSIMYAATDIGVNIREETKRSVLSAICQIFDPLGLLGPFIIRAKIIMQEMWLLKISWDEPIPQHLENLWSDFKRELLLFNEISIPRQAIYNDSVTIELHAFSDASEKAYGSCVFIRCVKSDGRIYSNLLCAKSRVAPIKKLTLPRLELCAALLTAQLVNKVNNAIKLEFNSYFYYTDSTVTLAWIKGESHRWKTFVANRVCEIQTLTNSSDWYHIPSNDNAADILSRGCSLKSLQTNTLWWQGPHWFLNNNASWNLTDGYDNTLEIPESKVVSNKATIVVQNALVTRLLERISYYAKLLGVTAFIIRFCNKIKSTRRNVTRTPNWPIIDPLSPDELQIAEAFLIKEVQKVSFATEYYCLKTNKPLPKRSAILSLNPFLKDDLIRVGGRLSKAKQPFDKRFPIILPKSHVLTDKILTHVHRESLHCGTQQLLCTVREKYWPISSRNACKKIIKKCVICIKAQPKGLHYLMGDLPDVRINVYSPFLNVGVDFGGPFLLKDRKTRFPKLIKGYLCLFVCMNTKALHLDIVTELSSDAFFAVLRRFIGRRGTPANLFSDNGSNFVGANNELLAMYNFLKDNHGIISNELASKQIKWHFIPAKSPHFGGLWESGIKSVKFHLKRLIGENHYTYEDFLTLIIQIEGILNSRPLAPLTADPEDLTPLTPGHFLIGRSLSSLPESLIHEVPSNRLNRFKQLQFIIHNFWKRWQKEYLCQLQARSKWKQRCPDLLKLGSMVLVQGNNNTFVSNWQLARITQLHLGHDGIVRVVDLKTQNGEIRRPVTKICVLPVESDFEN